jgi:dihydrofolate reductase
MSDNGAIGANGKIPWRIPDDMRHFKILTMGKPVLMGRRTWDSLPKRPLPGRKNIVVTRDEKLGATGALIARSLEEALGLAEIEDPAEVMIIGGAEIYRLALPHAQRVYLTEVHAAFNGDVFMDKFDPIDWRESSREGRTTKDGLRYSYVSLERR